jgi:hypothetical protein
MNRLGKMTPVIPAQWGLQWSIAGDPHGGMKAGQTIGAESHITP